MNTLSEVNCLLFLSLAMASMISQPAKAQQEFRAQARAKPGGLALPRGVPFGIDSAGLYDAANQIATDRMEVDRLLAEDTAGLGRPQRVGVVQDLSLSSAQDGRWLQLDDGAWLWAISFRAPGARAIRLRIPDWRPPCGAHLHFYNANDPTESFGPITGSYPTSGGTLWTPIIFSDEVRLEYYLPRPLDHVAPEWQITVNGLLNHYAPIPRGGGVGTPVCCHLDATCSPAWSDEADGVGAIFRTDDALGFFCSGGMLNRVGGADDFTPLFCTATHCGINASNVANTIIVWFYESQTCGGNDPPRWADLPQTPAATVLAQDVTTDWTLLGLRSIGDVPGGVTYLGWTSGTLANGSSVTGIHHPAGSYKRISFGSKVDNNGVCTTGSSYYQVTWSSGTTEGGSSGSPLLDSNGRVRGTLNCGPSPNCPPSCVANPITDKYGRLDQAFGFVEPWLNPVDPIFVSGGYSGVERGTITEPFNTVTEGVYAVISGSEVFIASGSYDETLIIDKPMTLNTLLGGTVTIGN